tara:strand:+ start:937 stop:1350 length:414 start_codon:yes stop_codon:yes gene_type:complete
MIITEIISGKIKTFPSQNDRSDEGSELVFNGRVRSIEDGRPILSLDYEYYQGMAETQLKQLAEETVKKFPIRDLLCQHRVGEVKVGETSLHVVIWSKHRKEGLNAITYFISELKKRIPIWKWAILKNGDRIPSMCSH